MWLKGKYNIFVSGPCTFRWCEATTYTIGMALIRLPYGTREYPFTAAFFRTWRSSQAPAA